jgi:hypothetical protein
MVILVAVLEVNLNKVNTLILLSKENGPVQFVKQTIAHPNIWVILMVKISMYTDYGPME